MPAPMLNFLRGQWSGRSLWLLVLSAPGLLNCWPSFPQDKLKDGGTDAPFDALRTDVLQDATGDIATDAAPARIRGGWLQCDVTPTPSDTITHFGSGPPGARDLAFNNTALTVVGDGFVRLGPTGVSNPPSVAFAPLLGSRAARFIDNASLAVAQSYDDGMGITEVGVAIANNDWQITRVGMSGTDVRGLAVGLGGAVYYTDAVDRSINRRADLTGSGGSFVVYAFPSFVPEQLALSPDGRLLYATVPASRTVYEIPLSASGLRDGAPVPYIADIANPQGIAFDECGNMYLSTGNRIVRVRATTREVEPVVSTVIASDDAGATVNVVPRGLAFGSGAFGRTHLYMVDTQTNAVYRTNVGISGQQLPR